MKQDFTKTVITWPKHLFYETDYYSRKIRFLFMNIFLA